MHCGATVGFAFIFSHASLFDNCLLLFAGLVPAVLLDAVGREVQNADPNCGLFIRSRQVGGVL